MNEIILDGESLTFEQVCRVAHGKPNAPRLVLSEKARKNVRRAADAVQELLAKGEIAYGITTGFGALKDVIIPLEEVERLQKNIVLSHAVGVGAAFELRPCGRSCSFALTRSRADFPASGWKLWSF
jgi:histidine ammonia-lyase